MTNFFESQSSRQDKVLFTLTDNQHPFSTFTSNTASNSKPSLLALSNWNPKLRSPTTKIPNEIETLGATIGSTRICFAKDHNSPNCKNPAPRTEKEGTGNNRMVGSNQEIPWQSGAITSAKAASPIAMNVPFDSPHLDNSSQHPHPQSHPVKLLILSTSSYQTAAILPQIQTVILPLPTLPTFFCQLRPHLSSRLCKFLRLPWRIPWSSHLRHHNATVMQTVLTGHRTPPTSLKFHVPKPPEYIVVVLLFFEICLKKKKRSMNAKYSWPPLTRGPSDGIFCSIENVGNLHFIHTRRKALVVES